MAAFECWEAEWPFMERMLRADLRNNSAWAQRAFLLTHRLACRVRSACLAAGSAAAGGEDGSDAAFVQAAAADCTSSDAAARESGVAECCAAARACGPPPGPAQRCMRGEVRFIACSAAEMPHNESAWNHLCGLPRLLSGVLAQCAPGGAKRGMEEACAQLSIAKAHPPLVEGRAAAFLAQCPATVQQDVQAAAQHARQAAFDVALEVLRACPQCIPARTALLKAYAAAAATAPAGSQQLARAREAAAALAEGLAAADPLRRGWYAAVVDGMPVAP